MQIKKTLLWSFYVFEFHNLWQCTDTELVTMSSSIGHKIHLYCCLGIATTEFHSYIHLSVYSHLCSYQTPQYNSQSSWCMHMYNEYGWALPTFLWQDLHIRIRYVHEHRQRQCLTNLKLRNRKLIEDHSYHKDERTIILSYARDQKASSAI